MGCSCIGFSDSSDWSDSCESYVDNKDKDTSPMPNIYVYKILKKKYINKFLIILINYPHCKNYEGNKLLIFKDVRLSEIIKQGFIDPHFGKICHYPIARFSPTIEGWEMACLFCRLWND